MAQNTDVKYNDGTVRNQIRPGLHVYIVLKEDQGTDKLTEGIVKDILTSAPEHPRGIKVRLESGDVGRVRAVQPITLETKTEKSKT